MWVVLLVVGMSTATLTVEESFSSNGHDVAVVEVTPLGTVVGNDYYSSMNISVTVENQGDFTETFDVTVYANTTVAGTRTNFTLTSGNQATITFTWNTEGVSYGEYCLSAVAHPLPDETDTDDNTCNDGWITVTIKGDNDADGDVDYDDFINFAGAYGSKIGDRNYDPNCDFDNDGDVDFDDFIFLAYHYGMSI